MNFDVDIYRSQKISDIIIFKPSVSWDNRGNIYSSFFKKIYEEYLPNRVSFIHDKFALSKRNVLRGLHGDSKTWKLVTCVFGEIFQVVVDMREGSSTYKKWDSWIIKSQEPVEILIPPGFVNGYYVKSDVAIFHYKLAYKGDYIDAKYQKVVKWNDPTIGIKWPCTNPILQIRDK